MPTIELTEREREIVVDLFERAAEQFGNHGCNDYPMPNTDENWALIVAYEEYNHGKPWDEIPEDERPERPKARDKIYGHDSALMSYFVARIRDAE